MPTPRISNKPPLRTLGTTLTSLALTCISACEKQPANQNQATSSSNSDARIMDPLQDIPLDETEEVPIVLRIDRDNIEITESCIIPTGAYRVPDPDNNGVLHVTADNVTITFEPGAVLVGAADDQLPDAYTGTGIRIADATGVTVAGATIRGYKAGIHATNATGLTLADITVDENFRQHLRSTPAAEDGSDWLWPHRNDDNEWLNNYGAAMCVEDSTGVTVRNCRVRNSQNGLILDRVSEAKVYDNDCSFLSGWGLAMWRTTDSVITRNAFDFCVRGYSHGVYNRGQDSAGILMFEQCCNNLIAENSATHGGDCFFGFAGREALGEQWLDDERNRLRQETGRDDVASLLSIPDEVVQAHAGLGNNNNLLIANDFSYAPAHGIEMTFSFNNRFINNRMVENAICGIWGGYSQDTLISGNRFEGNGEMAYGLERGGINIEHSRGNRVEHNTFTNNKCGVFFWWDPDEGLLQTPWGKANNPITDDNTIANNRFESDVIAIQLRQATNTNLANNILVNIREKEIDADPESETEIKHVQMPAAIFTPPSYVAYGESVPYGARTQLRGRQNIIMTEWGPWDHESPLMWVESVGLRDHRYQLLKAAPITGLDMIEPASESVFKTKWHDNGGIEWGDYQPTEQRQDITISAPSQPGVYPYHFIIKTGDDRSYDLAGTFIVADWTVTVFPWTVDPREDLDGWYAEARGPEAVTSITSAVTFKYNGGGPSHIGISQEITDANFKPDYFGTLAHTTIPLTAGTWIVSTLSDDGVRVTVDGQTVIDNWTWHGPTRNDGTFTLDRARDVDIRIEHFEIDGWAVLEFELKPT